MSERQGRVEGKIAIITGAASGIGLEIARMLAAEGAKVVMTDLNEEAGSAAASAIGPAAIFQRQDVTRELDWERLMAFVESHLGPPAILVNNAAIGNQGARTTPEDTTLDDWREVMRVNGESVFLGCRYAIQSMRERGGSIINMSSIAGILPSPQLTGYGFSKAGVCHLTRSVALHCARSGYQIRCNSVHPGQIEGPTVTRMFQELSDKTGAHMDTIHRAALARIPLGEFGSATDVAYGVLYLASDESRHVTGTQLIIDGGMDLAN